MCGPGSSLRFCTYPDRCVPSNYRTNWVNGAGGATLCPSNVYSQCLHIPELYATNPQKIKSQPTTAVGKQGGCMYSIVCFWMLSYSGRRWKTCQAASIRQDKNMSRSVMWLWMDCCSVSLTHRCTRCRWPHLSCHNTIHRSACPPGCCRLLCKSYWPHQREKPFQSLNSAMRAQDGVRGQQLFLRRNAAEQDIISKNTLKWKWITQPSNQLHCKYCC